MLCVSCREVKGSCARVLEDNQGAKAMAESPFSTSRNKHIHGRFHLFRELLRSRKVDVQFAALGERHADILTNSLAATPQYNLTVGSD